MPDRFDAYLRALRRTPQADHTEHTGRTALETLLNTFAAKNVTVQHEPKRVAGTGAPDFKITSKGMILGYAETKPMGENLDKVLKSDQIKKYKKPVAKYTSHQLSAFHLDQQGRCPARGAL